MARAWLLRNTTLWGGLMLFTVLSLFQKLQITQVLVLEDDATPGRFWNNLPPPPRQLSNLAASNDITRTTPLRQQHKIPSISTTNHGRNNNRQPVQDSSPLKKKTTSSRTTIQDDDTVVPDASIVVQLSGEMGNNLNKIAFGRGLQLLMKEQYGIHVNLVLRHQAHPKWILARKSIQKCFPNLRQFDFEAGNRPEMKEREIQQKLTFGYKSFGLILNEKVHNETRTMQVLDNLQALVNQTRGNSNSNMPMMMMEPGANIRVPYILADQMVDLSFLDRFKDDFWEFFQFDDQRCCAQLPEADETVFHFRNFLTELQGATNQLGFQELSPRKTAEQLFGKLTAGEKVAITTRFDNSVTQEYVHELEQRGLQVRVVSGQTGVADFCFLKQAKKELVGMQKSSFFHWAAYLGQVDKVRSYLVETNTANEGQQQQQKQQQAEYEWSDGDLRSRFHHETYPAG